MKKTIIAIAIAAASFNALAGDKEDACMEMGKISETIMQVRQAGRPISYAIGAASAVEKEVGEDAGKLVMTIIKMAYSIPVMSSEEDKQEAASEFGNQVTLTCLRQFK